MTIAEGVFRLSVWAAFLAAGSIFLICLIVGHMLREHKRETCQAVIDWCKKDEAGDGER